MALVLRKSQEFVKAHTKGNLIMAEVGVFQGGNALRMLSLGAEKLFLVDPYLAYKQFNQPDYTYNQKQLDEALLVMLGRLRPCINKTTIILQYSVIAATLFPDKYFDFVYLDGDHSYKSVMDDLIAWYPKVKIGGFLGGHDFVTPDEAKACREFAEKKKLDLKYWVDPKDYKPIDFKEGVTLDGDKDWIMIIR